MSELKNYEDHTKEIKEIINGKIYYMSGGTSLHSMIILRLRNEFISYFTKSNNDKCDVHTEGLNIFLNPKDKKNYVEPDISIICDDSKFFKRGYKGIPELIIEVASRKTRQKDRGDKYKLYEKSNVKEYWLVEPRLKSIEQYILKDDGYNLKKIFNLLDDPEESENDEEESNTDVINDVSIITSTIFEDLKMDLNKIFKTGDERFLREDD